jgi:hypothetical protein
MMLSDEEREVRIAAFAPENGFVLHPAGPPLIFHCDKQVNTELRKSDFKHYTKNCNCLARNERKNQRSKSTCQTWHYPSLAGARAH